MNMLEGNPRHGPPVAVHLQPPETIRNIVLWVPRLTLCRWLWERRPASLLRSGMLFLPRRWSKPIFSGVSFSEVRVTTQNNFSSAHRHLSLFDLSSVLPISAAHPDLFVSSQLLTLRLDHQMLLRIFFPGAVFEEFLI